MQDFLHPQYVQFIASGPSWTLEVQLLTRALEVATGHCEEVEAAERGPLCGRNDFPRGNEHGDSTWVISHVPMFHITQPLGINGLFYGYFFMWCPIAPKWDSYQPLFNGDWGCHRNERAGFIGIQHDTTYGRGWGYAPWHHGALNPPVCWYLSPNGSGASWMLHRVSCRDGESPIPPDASPLCARGSLGGWHQDRVPGRCLALW